MKQYRAKCNMNDDEKRLKTMKDDMKNELDCKKKKEESHQTDTF